MAVLVKRTGSLLARAVVWLSRLPAEPVGGVLDFGWRHCGDGDGADECD
ncbi:MAG: hypothetical protein RLN87_02385 [Parasphingopyxis sp.]|nr:hypothetical protein [uncultured Parasphingopyxis sp.]